ncbi:MAG: glycosyltransferase [Methylovulum sp.]|nr:glycosyltransferase [Methylovulum sp.]
MNLMKLQLFNTVSELKAAHDEQFIHLASRVIQGQEVGNEFRQTINLTEVLNSLNVERNVNKNSAGVLVDIIIPVYKNAHLTKLCIDSVLANIPEIQEFSPRLIIINDSPDDDGVNSLLKELALSNPEILIMTNIANCGFVKSVNRGLAVSIKDGRNVILVNSDTETFKGTLVNLLNVAYSDPQIGFVSPRSNNASLCSLPHAPISNFSFSPEIAYERWKEIGATLPKFHFTPTAIGFYMFIKHEILANFGGLREEFGVGYEEENDLVIRANKVGYRAALANHSFAYHAGSASFNLLDMDLNTHQNDNLEKMCADHPEFLPLVRRYESSAHFRAEALLSGLLGSKSGLISVVMDLSGLGCHHNGTNELSLNIVESLSKNYRNVFDLYVICPQEVFDFHEIKKFHVQRADLSDSRKYAIAIMFGQPFDQHRINVLEMLAPINIFGMLDTIAEDCGHLSITHNLADHWQHVARHANGVFFISQFAEKTFCNRYPDAKILPKYTRLLPTRLSSYANGKCDSSFVTEHILILGNHFPHKDSDVTAIKLKNAFPDLKFVVLGADTFQDGNLYGYRSGTLEAETVSKLFSLASVVVLPSYVEGFGFGIMHALAAGKPIVARNIDATKEILNTYKKVDGVFLYNNNMEIKDSLAKAIKHNESKVDDSHSIGWDEWVDGLAQFFLLLTKRNDLFSKLCDRIYTADLLRKRY